MVNILVYFVPIQTQPGLHCNLFEYSGIVKCETHVYLFGSCDPYSHQQMHPDIAASTFELL